MRHILVLKAHKARSCVDYLERGRAAACAGYNSCCAHITPLPCRDRRGRDLQLASVLYDVGPVCGATALVRYVMQKIIRPRDRRIHAPAGRVPTPLVGPSPAAHGRHNAHGCRTARHPVHCLGRTATLSQMTGASGVSCYERAAGRANSAQEGANPSSRGQRHGDSSRPR